jgi:hypothetical protein
METIESEVLADVIAECAKADGWANLAEIGVLLRKKNVAYGKLSKFILKFPDIIEIRIDELREPPVTYARLKGS